MLIADGGGYVPVKPRQTASSGSAGGTPPSGGTPQTTFAQHMKTATSGGSNGANGTASWSNGDPNYQVVKHRNTLIGLSNEDHVPLSELYALNREFDPRRQDGVLHYGRSPHGGWDPDFIKPGDHIYLPYHPQPKAPPPLPRKATEPATVPQPTAKPQSNKQHPAAPFFSFKWGGGPEFGFKGTGKGLAVSGDPYIKVSFGLGSHINVNLKLKYTPNGKVADLQVPKPPDPKAKPRPAGWKPEKMSLDAGIVVNKRGEVGLSWEFKEGGLFSKQGLRKIRSQLGHPQVYGASKSPDNVLVDTEQVKAGKFGVRKIASAARAGDWKTVNEHIKGGEVQIAAEKAWYKGPADSGHASVFTNQVAKSTVGDVVDGYKATKPTTRWTEAGSFGVGFGASYAGSTITDKFFGKYIPNAPLRAAADGTGGLATGLLADQVTRKIAPNLLKTRVVAGFLKTPLIAKPAALLAKPVVALAKPVAGLLKPIATSKAGQAIGSFLSKEAPTLAADAKFAAKLRFGARVAGPVGAAIAAAPDVISAVNSFVHGKVAAGFTSLADGAIRAGATVAGAAIGQALIPIPGVGAAIGGIAGGFIGDEIVGHQGQIVGAAKAVGKGLVSAGKAVGHAAAAVANFFGF
jgi:hypothetical protein